MLHQIKLASDTSLFVELPDVLPEGQPFSAKVDGKPVTLCWWPSLGQLTQIDETSGVERNLRLRARRVSSIEGTGELRVAVEVTQGAGVAGAVATVAPHVPGQAARRASQDSRSNVVRSQITGKVLDVLVAVGDQIEIGQPLLIIEAMKMENRIFAASAGKVEFIAVAKGDSVAAGKELLRLA